MSERSSHDTSPPRAAATGSEAPSLLPVARYYGPRLVVALLAGGLLWRAVELEQRVTALEEASAHAAHGAASVGAPVSGEPEGGGAEPVPPPLAAVRGAAPEWPCGVRLDEAAVRTVVGREGRAVFACIEARRAERPDLNGRVEVRIRVGEAGAVEAVHVGGLEDDELVGCVGEAVMGWTFPSPGAGQCAVVSAPFAVGGEPS